MTARDTENVAVTLNGRPPGTRRRASVEVVSPDHPANVAPLAGTARSVTVVVSGRNAPVCSTPGRELSIVPVPLKLATSRNSVSYVASSVSGAPARGVRVNVAGWPLLHR